MLLNLHSSGLEWNRDALSAVGWRRLNLICGRLFRDLRDLREQKNYT